MVLLGIDPGIHRVGYAFLSKTDDKLSILEYGVIETSSDLSLPQRLSNIVEDLSLLCQRFHPDSAAVEKLYFAKNTKTALNVSEARGAVIQMLSSLGLEIFEYTPLQVKIAIAGYGRASKDQIQQMVKVHLGLDYVPKPDDAADALAVGICHIDSFRPLEIRV